MYYTEYQCNTKRVTMKYYADEITFEDSIPELNLPAGTNLKDVILRIVEKIISTDGLLQGELYPTGHNSITAKDIQYEGTTQGGLSQEAQKLIGSEIKIKVERGAQAADITLNAKDFITLPPGAQIASSSISVSGQKENGRTQIVPSSKQPIMNVNVNYSRFPLTIDARVIVNTVDGDVELRKSIQVNADQSIEQMTPFEVTDRNSQPVVADLQGAMKQIESRINHLETKIK